MRRHLPAIALLPLVGALLLSGCTPEPESDSGVEGNGDVFDVSTASPDTGATTTPEQVDCQAVSAETLAALTAIVVPANDGDLVETAEATYDDENGVWLVSGLIVGGADDETPALWATEGDPTSSTFDSEFFAVSAGAQASTAEEWDVTLTAEEVDAAICVG